MKILIVLFLLLCSHISYAGEVFVTKDTNNKQAIKIYEVDKEELADLIVYKTNSPLYAMNKDEVWHISTNSTVRNILFINNKNNADLYVYFTNKKNDGAWRIDSKNLKYFSGIFGGKRIRK